MADESEFFERNFENPLIPEGSGFKSHHHLFSDMFSQISDSNGHLILWKFDEYLKEVLALPAAVYESPSFSYSSELANTVFNTVYSAHEFFFFSLINHYVTEDATCNRK